MTSKGLHGVISKKIELFRPPLIVKPLQDYRQCAHHISSAYETNTCISEYEQLFTSRGRDTTHNHRDQKNKQKKNSTEE
jgi:hypothetical protein